MWVVGLVWIAVVVGVVDNVLCMYLAFILFFFFILLSFSFLISVPPCACSPQPTCAHLREPRLIVDM